MGGCLGVQRTEADHLCIRNTRPNAALLWLLCTGAAGEDSFQAVLLRIVVNSEGFKVGDICVFPHPWGGSLCSPLMWQTSCLEPESLKPRVTGALSHGLLWFPHFKSWFILSKSMETCWLVSGVLIPNISLWLNTQNIPLTRLFSSLQENSNDLGIDWFY